MSTHPQQSLGTIQRRAEDILHCIRQGFTMEGSAAMCSCTISTVNRVLRKERYRSMILSPYEQTLIKQHRESMKPPVHST